MQGGLFRHRQPKGPDTDTARPKHHRATPRLYRVGDDVCRGEASERRRMGGEWAGARLCPVCGTSRSSPKQTNQRFAPQPDFRYWMG